MPHLDTTLIHGGEPKPRHQRSVVLPIYQSATFESGEEGSYHDILYARLNNTPNHLALHAKLAAIEGAEAALVTGSGMAAISTALLTVLSAGDHLLVNRVLYGGTFDVVTKDLPKLGITFDFIDGCNPKDWPKKLKKETRAVYVETLTNPLLEVADHEEVVALAREHGLVSLIDNTFASPVNFRPAEHGYDLSLHSATKYLNGHSDLIAGAVIGRKDLIDAVTHKLNHFGGTLGAQGCFLLQRGMKTLGLRVRHQNESAGKIAEFFASHRAVQRVNYPGLTSHPQHERAKKLLDGFGGMLSIELKGGVDAARRLIDRAQIAIHGPSLGGAESLMSRPAVVSHAGLSAEERKSIGVSDALVRISVGLEHPDDLIADFKQALA